MKDEIKPEHNKIYFISYGQSTQIVGRFKDEDGFNYYFYDYLHYWNGYETFHSKESYCIKKGVVMVQRASLAEKHSLIRFEIEHDCI